MALEDFRNGMELRDSGYVPKTAQESLAGKILDSLTAYKKKGYSKDESMALLFRKTIVDPKVLESLISALVGGSHILFFGPSGTGKTSLAKELWEVFPKEIYTVEGCPVQDDPMSVIDPGFNSRVPCCPSCEARFGAPGNTFDTADVDPTKVPVVKMNLREGYGLARVQGSSEVFPDNLTGVFNLHKLEELGDPTSPLILEPGKLLQANRGFLLVDEVDGSRITLEYCLRELLSHDPEEIAVAVLHNKNKEKKGSIPKEVSCYFCGEEMEDRWIVYPWDAEDIELHDTLA